VVSALHMEALRRRGVLDVRKVPPDPWAPGAAFEYRFTGTRRRHVRRLNAWGVMELFLPQAWRKGIRVWCLSSSPESRTPNPGFGCPSDYVISEAADRRMERLMSRRKQTTWPWSGASLFPSGPTASHAC